MAASIAAAAHMIIILRMVLLHLLRCDIPAETNVAHPCRNRRRFPSAVYTQNFPDGGGIARASAIGLREAILKLRMRQFLTNKLVCG
jgi:hypothetical protein